MKKFRQRLLEVKEGFLDGKTDCVLKVLELINRTLISVLYLVASTLWIILHVLSGMNSISYISMIAIILAYEVFMFYPKAFKMFYPLSRKMMIFFFCRYGRVITKKDWKKIKKNLTKEGFRSLRTKRSKGYCYFYSWIIALSLDNAGLMYGSIKLDDGSETGHAVVVKNNCVYDTNARQHIDLEEYKERWGFNLYKVFSYEEYKTKKFFDNIREDFRIWCAERNAYCEPQ